MNFTEAEIGAMLDEGVRRNQQLLFHTGGDRTIEALRREMQRRSEVDWKRKRIRIEHGDGITGDLVRRVHEMRLVVVQYPTHFSMGELVPPATGPTPRSFHYALLWNKGC